jgi:hypothetical protein
MTTMGDPADAHQNRRFPLEVPEWVEKQFLTLDFRIYEHVIFQGLDKEALLPLEEQPPPPDFFWNVLKRILGNNH